MNETAATVASNGADRVRAMVETTVDEYIVLVRQEPDHPLFMRLASPKDDDRLAMGRLVYNLALLAGVYAQASTIDTTSLHRDVRREVRSRPWLRGMAYDYLHQAVEDSAVAMSLKALVG